MNATILLPLLVCIIGALVYALAASQKLANLGALSFFAGLLVTLFQVSSHVIHF